MTLVFMRCASIAGCGLPIRPSHLREFDWQILKMKTIHIIPNAHLDPVWLWDWREGVHEALNTARSIVALMKERHDLTVVRGEAWFYEQVERWAPDLFSDIRSLVESRRWDVVGGNYIQPDHNLPDTETMIRQYVRGKKYFQDRFGIDVRVGWAADCFGHSAGMPAIFEQVGIDNFAFSRPNQNIVRLESSVFWWVGAAGQRVLCFRPADSSHSYGCERDDVHQRLDAAYGDPLLERFGDAACMVGVGNHGGGPTRRHLRDIEAWLKQHDDVRVIYSGWTRFFQAIRDKLVILGEDAVPSHQGELNYCLRGCYSSGFHIKRDFRRLQAKWNAVERSNVVLAAASGEEAARLWRCEDAVLFNAFHDILPASGVRDALELQRHHMHGAEHELDVVEFETLTKLARRIDTTVHPGLDDDKPGGTAVMLWNSLPYPMERFVEAEVCVDHRPVFEYRDRADQLPIRILDAQRRSIPFQLIVPHSRVCEQAPWRRRVLFSARLPALGWSIHEIGWVEGHQRPESTKHPAIAKNDTAIANEHVMVGARRGDRGVSLMLDGKPWLAEPGLSAAVYDDPWGCWGGMAEEKNAVDVNQVRERWTVCDVSVRESGPLRSVLWVRLAGNTGSHIDLSFRIYAGQRDVEVEAGGIWNERSARLKLILPCGDVAEYEVPGGSVVRGPSGEVPGGRWIWIKGRHGQPGVGFASDSLYGFSTRDNLFHATVIRATRYADELPADSDQDPWRDPFGVGEFRLRFSLSSSRSATLRMADQIEQPPRILVVESSFGPLPRGGSIAELHGDGLRLLSIVPERSSGLRVRVQEMSGRATEVHLTLNGTKMLLGEIPGRSIKTFTASLK
ncbi:MAG: hypothetical protein IT446_13960 [Phycisphaerales bacterium]|nr:hypothetical protein [Phycisphaerales bacterium]